MTSSIPVEYESFLNRSILPTSVFPSCSHVKTTVWLHPLNFKQMPAEKLDGKYTIAILNKFWMQLATKP